MVFATKIQPKSAFSLIEVMVATLILTIVFISSALFFASPPVLFEARQQAATSEAAGILQRLFVQWPEEYPSHSAPNGIWLEYTETGFPTVITGTRNPLPETESFDYELYVTNGTGTLVSHSIANLLLFKRGGMSTNVVEALQLLLPSVQP